LLPPVVVVAVAVVEQRVPRRCVVDVHVPAGPIEESVSLDPTRHCIQTYNQNRKIQVRILNSTDKVIRASLFRLLSVLEVT
jgi:hypothetical protein